ncbi:hypothetical protein BZA77DRAFT_314228 [Pyronema omphalodes]|nr:hypothetical protein BZA77DRAFT_314228 [Pyronema omphalodes]
MASAATIPRRSSSVSTLSITESESNWHSLPLAFAILPAIGGILFTNGSLIITDALLILLCSLFLHQLIKFPWEWYQSSQIPNTAAAPRHGSNSELASRELNRNEISALVCCFLGPLIGGAILHAIRSQLSRPSEGLVSNLNLTVFILAAEIRPASQVMKLIRERTLNLQRQVGEGEQQPMGRVEELEMKLREMGETVKELVQASRTQKEREKEIEVLRGAVRRYERKEAASQLATETRILEINRRLSMTEPQQGVGEWVLGWLLAPLLLTWKLVGGVLMFPVTAVVAVLRLLMGAVRSKGKRD